MKLVYQIIYLVLVGTIIGIFMAFVSRKIGISNMYVKGGLVGLSLIASIYIMSLLFKK
jgi:flagellar biosynthesis protein FliP